MKKRKHKKTIAKLGLIFVIILLSLASISMSYAAWTDTITIEGTVTTGTWAVNESAWARMYDDPDDFTHGFPGSSWATYIIHQPTEEPVTFYLYASQQYGVGELIVWKNTTHLIVEYHLDDGYDMEDTHLHIATLLEGIPHGGGGNPIPGQFDYTENHDPYVTDYTYNISWDPSWNNLDLYIAAHAVVWGIYL